MAGNSIHAASPTLSSLYAENIRLLGEFAKALGEENCRVVHLEQVRVNDVLEAYGRAKIWGDQTKADLPAAARGSLDDMLRQDDEIKLLTQNILRRMKTVLSEATSIAERKRDPALGLDYDSISSVSDDSSSSSAAESDEEEVERPQRRMPKIRLLVQQIQEQIRSLYNLSSLLRRPRVTDRYIRSVSSKPGADTALPLDVGPRVFDERHIAEKILQWRGLTKSGRGILFEEEEEKSVVTSQGLTADSIDDVPWLCRRLAQANIRRREQLQYWRDHPYVLKQNPTNAARTTARDMQWIETRQEEKSQGLGSQASTIKPAEIDLLRKGPGSETTRQSRRTALTAQSFSTAALSDIHNTKTNTRPQTVYAPTAIGQGRSNSVPDPPMTGDGSTAFSCPYCGMLLESSEMQNRQSWKHHVFRDLRPYVCTFQDCHNASKLYVSRHDWIYHELQVHRRRYVCQDCHQVYSIRSDILSHLRTHYHESSFSAAQLDVIADLCVRQMDIADTRQDPCLLCGESCSLSAMQRHLASHLEDLALFVLPSTDEDEGGTSNASIRVAKLGSTGKDDDDFWKESSLDFPEITSEGLSKGKDLEEALAEFSELVASEDTNYESKISHPDMGEEGQKQLPPVDSASKPTTDVGDDAGIAFESTVDDKERTIWVSEEGHEYTVPEILEQGISLDSIDRNGYTPLHLAARLGNDEEVCLLLHHGANINGETLYKQTPLHLAAEKGHVKTVKLLIKKGGDVNARDNIGRSPLSLAAFKGYKSIVELLIDKGGDINARDNGGQSPLSWAASGGYKSIVELLIEKGGDVNARDNSGRSPLVWAASGGYTSVELLIEKGGDVNAGDNSGRLPLLWATFKAHESIAELLINNGSDISARVNSYKSVVELLIDKGGDINARDNGGRSPLSLAAFRGYKSIVELLIDKGGDINARDNSGQSPLLLAASKGRLSTVEFFLGIQNSKADLSDKATLEILWPLAKGGRNAVLSLLLKAIRDGLPASPSQNASFYRVGTDWCSVYDPGKPCVLDVDLAHCIPLKDLNSVKFSQDGRCFALVCELTAHIYRVATGEKLCELQDSTYYHGSPNIEAICFSHGSQYLITAVGPFLNVWDITSQRILRTMHGHEGKISSVNVARDYSSIVSGSSDGTVQLWNMDTGQNLLTINAGQEVTCVAISPDTKYVAAGILGVGVHVWDVQQGSLVLGAEFPYSPRFSSSSVSWSSDSNRLVINDRSSAVYICDTSMLGQATDMVIEGKIYVGRLGDHEIVSSCLTPNDAWILSASSNGNLQFWDSRTLKECLIVQHVLFDSGLKLVSVSPAGGFFAAVGRRGAVIWSYRQV